MQCGLINDVFSKYPFDTTGFEGECSKRLCGVAKLIQVNGKYDLVCLKPTDEYDFNFEDGYNLKITPDIYTGPSRDKNGILYALDKRFSNVEFKHLDANGEYLTNYTNFDKHIRLFFGELVRIARDVKSQRVPYELERGINYQSETCEIVFYPPFNLVFTINVVNVRFPVFYQMSIGYSRGANTIRVLTNIIDLCLEIDKNSPLPPTIFSDILNTEHEKAIEYFDEYTIAAQYIAYAVITFLASIKTPSYAKSGIKLLLRHTPTDVLSYLFSNIDAIIEIKRKIQSYIITYHNYVIKDDDDDLNEFLNSSIDEDKKDTYFGATFFNVENGAIIEYRSFKTEIRYGTLFPSVLGVKQKYHTIGMGVKKSVKHKISRYNMARRIHKHTNKCRTNRSKCPLKKTRRRKLRGG